MWVVLKILLRQFTPLKFRFNRESRVTVLFDIAGFATNQRSLEFQRRSEFLRV